MFNRCDGCDGYCRRPGQEFVQPRGTQEVCVRQNKEGKLGGRRKAVCDSERKAGNSLQGAPRAHRVHEREAEQAVGNHGAKAKKKKMSGALEDVREKLLQEVLVLEDRISVEELELFEISEGMKELMMERRRTKAAGWRVSDVAGVGGNWKVASQARSSGSEVK